MVSGTITKIIVGLMISLAIGIATINLLFTSSEPEYFNKTLPQEVRDVDQQFRGPVRNLSKLTESLIKTTEDKSAFEVTASSILLVPQIVAQGLILILKSVRFLLGDSIDILLQAFPELGEANGIFILLMVTAIGAIFVIAILKIFSRSEI